jgi:hypothetical protein
MFRKSESPETSSHHLATRKDEHEEISRKQTLDFRTVQEQLEPILRDPLFANSRRYPVLLDTSSKKDCSATKSV